MRHFWEFFNFVKMKITSVFPLGGPFKLNFMERSCKVKKKSATNTVTEPSSNTAMQKNLHFEDLKGL